MLRIILGRAAFLLSILSGCSIQQKAVQPSCLSSDDNVREQTTLDLGRILSLESGRSETEVAASLVGEDASFELQIAGPCGDEVMFVWPKHGPPEEPRRFRLAEDGALLCEEAGVMERYLNSPRHAHSIPWCDPGPPEAHIEGDASAR